MVSYSLTTKHRQRHVRLYQRTERRPTRRRALQRGSLAGDCRRRFGQNARADLQDSLPDGEAGIPPMEYPGVDLHQQSRPRNERTHRPASRRQLGPTLVDGHFPLHLPAHPPCRGRRVRIRSQLHHLRHGRLAQPPPRHHQGNATGRKDLQTQFGARAHLQRQEPPGHTCLLRQ